MRRMLDEAIYYATAPIRLFGRSRRFRLVLGAGVVVAGFFAAAQWALNRLMPADTGLETALAIMNPPPPLPAVTKSSYVIAPVAVALAAIRRGLDAAAPRELAGKNDNPVSSLLSKADIGITVGRGTLGIAGKPNEMAVTAPISGTLRITGQIATQAGNMTGAITGLLDKSIGKTVGQLTSNVLDQRAELRGQVVVHAKPALTADWRLEPNLTSQIALADSSVTLAGFKLDLSNEARPLIEREVNSQIAALQTRLRNDPFIERAARTQWAKMCRSIPLGGGDTGLPKLWLEMRPVRVAAAQPQIDLRNMTLTVGVQAETRITPKETKPDCPFPAKLDLVPPMQNGKLAVGVPIDVPFSALNKVLEAQLKGKQFPRRQQRPGRDRGAQRASRRRRRPAADLAQGEGARAQKLVRLRRARRPCISGVSPRSIAKNQVLRLADLTLAVESQAAFGLLGAAARAGMPYLQQALADSAVIDLKPFAADAKKKIAAALAEFEKSGQGVRVDTAVDDLRLTGIAFNSATLRVIAEADGSAKVAVSELPKM